MRRCWLALAPVLAAGCELLEPGEAERIPGRYQLATYGGQALPAVIAGSAGGARVELHSAELEMRRNYFWVLRSQVDTVDERGRRSAAVTDSGTFRFEVAPGQLIFFTTDGRQQPAAVGGDTIDVFWRRERHDVFVR